MGRQVINIGAVLRLVPYVLAVGIIAWAIWYVVAGIHDHGRKMERLENMETQQAAAEEAENQFNEMEIKLQREADIRERKISKALGVYANEIIDLNNQLADANSRLFITAEKNSCPSDRVPGSPENKNIERADQPVIVELPGPLAAEIRRDYRAAAEIELKYNLLTKLISESGCFEVIE